jgi:hypothetical protein
MVRTVCTSRSSGSLQRGGAKGHTRQLKPMCSYVAEPIGFALGHQAVDPTPLLFRVSPKLLRQDPTWSGLTALYYFLETQPLPQKTPHT